MSERFPGPRGPVRRTRLAAALRVIWNVRLGRDYHATRFLLGTDGGGGETHFIDVSALIMDKSRLEIVRFFFALNADGHADEARNVFSAYKRWEGAPVLPRQRCQVVSFPLNSRVPGENRQNETRIGERKFFAVF